MNSNIEELQPILNIGTIGHVSHGKSTLVKALCGTKTQRFKSELERNITIKLGYSNVKIYMCTQCDKPKCYQSFNSDVFGNPCCKYCNQPMVFKRQISIIDSPGHEAYIATMLSGTKCMDGAIMLVAANDECPQPQTKEHLVAIEMMKINNCIILQNKLDLVTKDNARNNFNQIKTFVNGTLAKDSVIIPICAQLGYNIDFLNMYIVENIPVPKRDIDAEPLMNIIRSFDINKPGTIIDNLKGGVIGGTLQKGKLSIGDTIEIRPGLIRLDNKDDKSNNNKYECTPIISKIVSLKSENNNLEYAIPGGLIGVGLNIDPVLTIGDKLVGQVLGLPGKMPPIVYDIQIEYFLMRRVIGSTNENKIESITENENLLLAISSSTIPSYVRKVVSSKVIKCALKIPVCVNNNSNICIFRRINKGWRIIGYGIINKIKTIDV